MFSLIINIKDGRICQTFFKTPWFIPKLYLSLLGEIANVNYMNQKKYHDVDNLLKRLFSQDSRVNLYSLKELFQQRLEYLEITKNQARKILDVDHKVLDSILVGDTKKIDPVLIIKLAEFLEVPYEELFSKYFQLLSNTHSDSINLAKRRSYVVNNFDIPALKRIGLISSINDFDEIEQQINQFLGYSSIFEHSKHTITATYSQGKRKTNKKNLGLWCAMAYQTLEQTPNPNEYNREALIAFFDGLNEKNGLILIVQALFKMGITVIHIPKLNRDIHVKGATVPFMNKPCIILTKYTPFYATLWFTLIHELYHVLYDWDEILLSNQPHLTGETDSIKIEESAADNFARQYLFSDDKMNQVSNRINEAKFIKHFAEQNHVHPSIIYNFYCWDLKQDECYQKFNNKI